MPTAPDIDVFLEVANLYMHVEAVEADWESEFMRALHGFTQEGRKEAFRRGFAKAVLGGITPNQYERATGWDFASDEEFRAHLAHYWHLFYPDSKPEDWATPGSSFDSLDSYRGWKHDDGGPTYYTVERVDGSQVMRIEEPKLIGRTLHIGYELTSPNIYDGFARRLIRQKLLREVCLGSYDGQADTIEYTSKTNKKVTTLPYASD